MFTCVWRLRINSLKINLNSFIRNNVESGRRVFTLWVMQLHKLIPAHFTVCVFPQSADLRTVSTPTRMMQLWPCREKHWDWLQTSDFLNVQYLHISSVEWVIVCYICWKRWFMFSALESFAPQRWQQQTVCVILKVHAKILWSAQNSRFNGMNSGLSEMCNRLYYNSTQELCLRPT